MKQKQQNKAVITFDDFVFYVIYSRWGGYGCHTKKQLRKQVVQDLKDVPYVNGYRWGETDWVPISGMMADGFAEIKYDGVTTADGVAKMVENNYLNYAENTMGCLSLKFGHLPAVCLMDEITTPYYQILTPEDELKRNFKSKYYERINELQNIQHSEAYVGPMVFDERIEEACKAAYGKPYDELDGAEKKLADTKCERISELCDSLMDYLHDLAYDHNATIDHSSFVVDFRQLEFDFNN